jgi:hypothetical protein
VGYPIPPPSGRHKSWSDSENNLRSAEGRARGGMTRPVYSRERSEFRGCSFLRQQMGSPVGVRPGLVNQKLCSRATRSPRIASSEPTSPRRRSVKNRNGSKTVGMSLGHYRERLGDDGSGSASSRSSSRAIRGRPWNVCSLSLTAALSEPARNSEPNATAKPIGKGSHARNTFGRGTARDGECQGSGHFYSPDEKDRIGIAG